MKNLICLILFTYCQNLYSQNEYTAVAYPAQNIIIDGKLEDWPTNTKTYFIDQAFENDFKAQFKVAFNEIKKELYVLMEVEDQEFIFDEKSQSPTEDSHILYLDLINDEKGNAPLMFIGSKNNRNTRTVSSHFEPYNQSITWDDINLEVRRLNGKIIYEWGINLGDQFKIGKFYGFDHFVIDEDNDDKETIYSVWKPGYGKSQSGLRLGKLILKNEQVTFGQLNAKVNFPKGYKNTNFPDLIIKSKEPFQNFNLTVAPDSNGLFIERLPIGDYSLNLLSHFDATLATFQYYDDLTKVHLKSNTEFTITNEETTSLSINLDISKKPTPLGDKILYNKDIDKYELEKYIEEIKSYYNVPGVSVSIINDNEVILSKELGLSSELKKTPLQKEDLFEAASITKPVFCLIVLQLAKKGIIDLDRPLLDYLPFKNIEEDERSQKITARIVMNHQSGIPNWPWEPVNGWKQGQQLKLAFEPGTEFMYSGEAMNYLGRVVAYLTHKNVSQLFQELVAKPFGLTNTYFAFNSSIDYKMTTGHWQNTPRFKPRGTTESPASSLHTNARDFAKLLLGLMNEKVLSSESYNLIYKPGQMLNEEQRMFDPEIPQFISHGFFIQDTPEGLLIQHGGNNGDFECKFVYNKKTKDGFVAFANSNLGDQFVRDLEMVLF